MRVISDFRDYYDSAQGLGIDPNLSYARKQEIFEGEIPIAFRGRNYAGSTDTSFVGLWAEGATWVPDGLRSALTLPMRYVTSLPKRLVRVHEREAVRLKVPVLVRLIGFCGALYPAVRIDDKSFHVLDRISEGVSASFLAQYGLDRKELEQILAFGKPKSHRIYGYDERAALTYFSWRAQTSEFANRRFDEIFVQLGVPVFELECSSFGEHEHNVRCILNPRLKDDDFQRVKGPSEAFQEISMYLGNQLARQPDPISKTPDDIMRDEKGFDKWSFRRHKVEDRKFIKKNARGKASG